MAAPAIMAWSTLSSFHPHMPQISHWIGVEKGRNRIVSQGGYDIRAVHGGSPFRMLSVGCPDLTRAAAATRHHTASRMTKGMKAMIHDDQPASRGPGDVHADVCETVLGDELEKAQKKSQEQQGHPQRSNHVHIRDTHHLSFTVRLTEPVFEVSGRGIPFESLNGSSSSVTSEAVMDLFPDSS